MNDDGAFVSMLAWLGFVLLALWGLSQLMMNVLERIWQ
jgi:flagellar biogenesis protein FliO